MSFSFKKCRVRELIDDIYMTHQVLIAPRLEFLKEVDNIPLEINVDRERLIQVLTNFLNNASKFTETDTGGYYGSSRHDGCGRMRTER